MTSMGERHPIMATPLSEPAPEATAEAASSPAGAGAPQAKRPSWPKTPDGTTDWEIVFEAEETGVIALVTQANTAAALRACTIAVIEKLYVRDDDPDAVARFKEDLTSLIRDDMSPENVVRAKDTVAGILRGVKEYRIQKAAEYVERKKAEKRAADERRGAEKHLPPEIADFEYDEKPKARRRAAAAPADEDEGKSRLYWIGGIAAALVLAVCGGAYFYFAAPGGTAKKEPALVLIDQMKDAAANPNPPASHVFGGALRVGELVGRKAVIAEGVPADACGSAAWVFVNRGNVLINGAMPTRVAPNILAKLCAEGSGGATLTWVPK